MTERTQARAIMEAVFGRTLPNELLAKAVDACVADDPYELGGWTVEVTPDSSPPETAGVPTHQPSEPRDPTEEEKAELFNKTMRRMILTLVRGQAEAGRRDIERANARAAIKAAGDEAEAEFTQ